MPPLSACRPLGQCSPTHPNIATVLNNSSFSHGVNRRKNLIFPKWEFALADLFPKWENAEMGECVMQVVHWGRARKFFQKHKPAEEPLKQWRTAVQAAGWKKIPDVRKTFTTADWVDGRIVFDIKGNDYRLIAIAQFENEKLYIRHVLTHEQYDRGDWKK